MGLSGKKLKVGSILAWAYPSLQQGGGFRQVDSVLDLQAGDRGTILRSGNRKKIPGCVADYRILRRGRLKLSCKARYDTSWSGKKKIQKTETKQGNLKHVRMSCV